MDGVYLRRICYRTRLSTLAYRFHVVSNEPLAYGLISVVSHEGTSARAHDEDDAPFSP
jgi:hypothetical protein